MDEQNNRNTPQSRVKKGFSALSYITIAVVIFLTIGFYFYLQKISLLDLINQLDSTDVDRKALLSDQAVTPSSGQVQVPNGDQDGHRLAQQEKGLPSSDIDARTNNQVTESVNSTVQKERTQADNLTPPSSKDIEEQNQHRIDILNSFYKHLDQQPYMQSFGLKESSKVYFSKLVQKLVDNPPVVVRETDDLFTLLQNTAHFFRILGKDNVNLLKGILSTEQNSFEQTLKAFYELANQPQYLKKEYSISIPPHALTDYAAFFLNTMGGRLYLFRRDSTSRMVVNYYAIMTIDHANLAGNGGHGIDLRPAIISLIEEIENGGRRLQLRDEYLDALYDLQEKYN